MLCWSMMVFECPEQRETEASQQMAFALWNNFRRSTALERCSLHQSLTDTILYFYLRICKDNYNGLLLYLGPILKQGTGTIFVSSLSNSTMNKGILSLQHRHNDPAWHNLENFFFSWKSLWVVLREQHSFENKVLANLP